MNHSKHDAETLAYAVAALLAGWCVVCWGDGTCDLDTANGETSRKGQQVGVVTHRDTAPDPETFETGVYPDAITALATAARATGLHPVWVVPGGLTAEDMDEARSYVRMELNKFLSQPIRSYIRKLVRKLEDATDAMEAMENAGGGQNA